VDERADELVHQVMNKYRDRIWKEMAKVKKEHEIYARRYEKELEKNLMMPEGDNNYQMSY